MGITNDIMQIKEAMDMGQQVRLQEQFADDPWLREVVEALTNGDMLDIRAQRRARHRALNFTIEDGKLWRIQTKAKDRVTRVECISWTEGFKRATEVHKQNGNFGWDHTRLRLNDKWFWPGMDRDSKNAVTECSRCKNFGLQLINSLL